MRKELQSIYASYKHKILVLTCIVFLEQTHYKKAINQKKIIKDLYDPSWNNVCINVLEYGNIHLIDEILIYYSTEGEGSSITPITQFRKNQISFIQCVIPWHTQSLWFIHKFGFKFFLKYFLEFTGLFIMGEVIFLQSVYKELKK